MSNLKIADYSDYGYIYQFAQKFFEISPYNQLEFDKTKVLELIDSFLTGDQTEKIIILAMNEGKPIGLIGAMTSEMLFSRDRIASEVMWWMEPEHRNSRAGLQLLDAYEFWARKVGAKLIQLATVETEQTPIIAKVYARRGYKLSERAYLKELI